MCTGYQTLLQAIIVHIITGSIYQLRILQLKKYLPLSRFSFYIIHPLPYIAPAIWDKAGTNAHPRDGVQVQNDAPESENQIVRKVIHRNNGAATYSVFPYRVTALPPHG